MKSTRQTVSSNSVLTVSNSIGQDIVDFADTDLPPALPQKTKKKTERHPSPYDNVPDDKLGKTKIPLI